MDGRGQKPAQVLLEDEEPEKFRVAPLHVNKPRQGDDRQEHPAPDLDEGPAGPAVHHYPDDPDQPRQHQRHRSLGEDRQGQGEVSPGPQPVLAPAQGQVTQADPQVKAQGERHVQGEDAAQDHVTGGARQHQGAQHPRPRPPQGPAQPVGQEHPAQGAHRRRQAGRRLGITEHLEAERREPVDQGRFLEVGQQVEVGDAPIPQDEKLPGDLGVAALVRVHQPRNPQPVKEDHQPGNHQYQNQRPFPRLRGGIGRLWGDGWHHSYRPEKILFCSLLTNHRLAIYNSRYKAAIAEAAN